MKITTPKGSVIELTPEEAEMLFPGLVSGVCRQLRDLSVGSPGLRGYSHGRLPT